MCMGLKEIVAIREFTTFTPEGLVKKIYEVTFTTEKAPGEFTIEIDAEEYTAELAKQLAAKRAKEIDEAIG